MGPQSEEPVLRKISTVQFAHLSQDMIGLRKQLLQARASRDKKHIELELETWTCSQLERLTPPLSGLPTIWQSCLRRSAKGGNRAELRCPMG